MQLKLQERMHSWLTLHCKSEWNTKGLTKVQNGLSLYVFPFCVPFFVKKGTQDMILA